jgi:hypothetical protein
VPASITLGVVVTTPARCVAGVYPVGIWFTKSLFCVLVFVSNFSGTKEAPCKNDATPALPKIPVAIKASRTFVFAMAASRRAV